MSNDRKLTGVLLANTGTPDSPNPKDIKKYLKEFLSDRRIIKIPRIIWLPILYLIILNIRPYKKQKDYKKIWMKDGSPLLVLSKMLLDNIKLKNTNKDIFYSIGMRYGNPSIASELKNFQDIVPILEDFLNKYFFRMHLLLMIQFDALLTIYLFFPKYFFY